MVRSDYSDQGIDLNVEPESSIPCSICFDLVTYDGDRSRAKLKCGHEFHLEVAGVVAKQNGWIIVINDCIGSAFNAKGAMQCPNCRSVEKGQWKYSSGSLTSPELGVDDGSVDHYPFYFTLAETAKHWSYERINTDGRSSASWRKRPSPSRMGSVSTHIISTSPSSIRPTCAH
ncbi:E3 ubiquitin-protein ligase RFI2-like isoform X4 [Amaranthus tricolor]|uniref:E3 ubiquitin-protein ligase RFI2-like isoform X4 n=1 Tax=Amaranthus tricolor TaxID=29722 RepID=UPI00258E000D|nr:E3 ubiquitin-protein ligase RFI2-like isoform X4 [Amaranthus tricolor]